MVVEMNLALRGVGVLLLPLVAACTGTTAAPLAAPIPLVVAASLLGPRSPGPEFPQPQVPAAAEVTVVVTPLPQSALPGATPMVIAVAPVAEVPAPKNPRRPDMKDEPSAGLPPTRTTGALAPPVVAPAVIAPSPRPVIVVEPPLDVAALKLRLRETAALGMFTKLALKNQMDDLLMMFRIGHEGGDSQKVSIPSLRKPYNALVAKVVSLVAADDPPLARTIAGSREAIWGILADPQKFKAAS